MINHPPQEKEHNQTKEQPQNNTSSNTPLKVPEESRDPEPYLTDLDVDKIPLFFRQKPHGGANSSFRWVKSTEKNKKLAAYFLFKKVIFRNCFNSKKFVYYPCCNIFSCKKSTGQGHQEPILNAPSLILSEIDSFEIDQQKEILKLEWKRQPGKFKSFFRFVKTQTTDIFELTPSKKLYEFIGGLPKKDGCFFLPLTKSTMKFDCPAQAYFAETSSKTLKIKVNLMSADEERLLKVNKKSLIAPPSPVKGPDLQKEGLKNKILKVGEEPFENTIQLNEQESGYKLSQTEKCDVRVTDPDQSIEDVFAFWGLNGTSALNSETTSILGDDTEEAQPSGAHEFDEFEQLHQKIRDLKLEPFPRTLTLDEVQDQKKAGPKVNTTESLINTPKKPILIDLVSDEEEAENEPEKAILTQEGELKQKMEQSQLTEKKLEAFIKDLEIMTGKQSQDPQAAPKKD